MHIVLPISQSFDFIPACKCAWENGYRRPAVSDLAREMRTLIWYYWHFANRTDAGNCITVPWREAAVEHSYCVFMITDIAWQSDRKKLSSAAVYTIQCIRIKSVGSVFGQLAKPQKTLSLQEDKNSEFLTLETQNSVIRKSAWPVAVWPNGVRAWTVNRKSSVLSI